MTGPTPTDTPPRPDERHLRPLEAGIETDLAGRMTYGGYLQLDRLLSAQSPASNPPHHDELLFILQHQVSELWMKLLVHELRAALLHLRAGDLGPTQKIFARCKAVLRQLTDMWSVLETLTPSEYMQFREILGPSSGFQSAQYRTIEFLLGNKNAAMLDVFAHDPAEQAALRAPVPGQYLTLREYREQTERRYIVDTLKLTGWNISRTAVVLGVERTNLHKKIRGYQIKRGEG